MRFLPLLPAYLTLLASAAADPQLASWQTVNSVRYATVYQGSATTAVDTWPTGTSGQIFGGQSTPAYSDVQRVTYSSDYVYVNSTGLASYTMGPWFQDAAKTVLFQNWPADSGLLMRFPRTPAVATNHTTSGLGPIAMAVNGVVYYNGQDAFSYSSSSGTDLTAPQGSGIWNRDALLSESVTFDPALAHQQNTGQYHYHVNPIGLRYQMGDHVTYSATSNAYTEATSTPVHSPILGWAFDGYPIYGPYGYSSPMDPTSGVRRMVSGFVKRDGTHGTTNLAVTGRTTLPQWAATAQGRSTTLTGSQIGPVVSTTRPLGYYQEDNDYLGNEGYTQGVDFDLNQYNARYCVTPDYPQGTWAYFVSIDSTNQPAFPYTVGPQYLGVVSGGSVSSISETVTEYTRGGAASPITVQAVQTASGALVTWASVEGGVYLVESSANDSTWITVASNVASGGASTSLATTTAQAYYRVTLTALATYDSSGSGSVTAIAGDGVGQLVGSTGTAKLTNLSARAYVGTGSNILIAGFGVSGAGDKQLVLRGVGPDMGPTFDISDFLDDAQLTLFDGGGFAGENNVAEVIAANNGWANLPTLGNSPASVVVSNASATLMNSVGAFPYQANSLDAAIVATAPAGNYSAQVSGLGASPAGVALAEIYDADTGTSTARLTNISARASVGTGFNVLIGGFGVSGSASETVLIRGIGPGLSSKFGLSGTLANPVLQLFDSVGGGNVIASNSGWGSAPTPGPSTVPATVQPATATLMTAVGAYALTANSTDAAMVVTLPPGNYTVQLSGVDGTTGIGAVEIYEVP